MTQGCPICGSSRSRMLCFAQQSPIAECWECSTVYRVKLITGDAYNALYQNVSLMETPFYEANKSVSSPDQEPIRTFAIGLDRLRKIGLTGGRLVDIGCSYGAFLQYAGSKGWDAEGVELSEHTARFAREQRNLKVFTGFVENAAFPSDHFDVITMWDVIEHFDDPVRTLRELDRILRPGGALLIFTLNNKSMLNRIGALLYSMSLRRWNHLMELFYDIHHNFFFTRETLEGLLNRVGSYTIEHEEYHPANIRRWRTVEISKILMLGCDLIDAASVLPQSGYRILLLARKQPQGEAATA